MKTIKILLVLATVSFFTALPYSIAEARDCSDPKGFHERMMCKSFGFGKSDSTATSSESNKGEMADGVKDKTKGALNWIKKSLKGKKVE